MKYVFLAAKTIIQILRVIIVYISIFGPKMRRRDPGVRSRTFTDNGQSVLRMSNDEFSATRRYLVPVHLSLSLSFFFVLSFHERIEDFRYAEMFFFQHH